MLVCILTANCSHQVAVLFLLAGTDSVCHMLVDVGKGMHHLWISLGGVRQHKGRGISSGVSQHITAVAYKRDATVLRALYGSTLLYIHSVERLIEPDLI